MTGVQTCALPISGFFDGHVLELIGRIGVVESYGNSTSVPLFDRWFLGGIDTLRGYRYREVGPQDYTGEPLGGGTYWFGSAEYSVPIIDRLRFAVFYDIGMVYPGAYSFRPQDTVFANYSSTTGSVGGRRLSAPRERAGHDGTADRPAG